MNANLAYLSHNTNIYLVYSDNTELKEDVKNKVICMAMCMYYVVFSFATLATLRPVKMILWQ